MEGLFALTEYDSSMMAKAAKAQRRSACDDCRMFTSPSSIRRLVGHAKPGFFKVHAKYSVAAILQDANDVVAQAFGVHTQRRNRLVDRERYGRLPKRTAIMMHPHPRRPLSPMQETSISGTSSAEI